MKMTFAARLIVVCFVITLARLTTAAQDTVQTRSITSDDLDKQRPAAATSKVKKPGTNKRKRVTYSFVRTDKNVIRRSKPAPTAPAKLTPKTTDIGVTMWKMRPPRANDRGYLLPVKDENGDKLMWLAERVDADTIFNAGDKVRFAVESSSSGYLYVFDREAYPDGSYGSPSLIFPESLDEDNSVKPGMLVDFPDQREQWPYFKMVPVKGAYAGELLTVIISPKPLTNIKLDEKGKVVNITDLTELEAGTEVAIFSRKDTADRIYSKTESESACGIKTRELEREKSSANPCAEATRLLTKEEPHPQSIYRVKGFAGQPAVAFVRLAVR